MFSFHKWKTVDETSKRQLLACSECNSKIIRIVSHEGHQPINSDWISIKVASVFCRPEGEIKE